MYLAGHVVVGDADETPELREGMLEIMVVLIRRLIEPNAKAMGTWLNDKSATAALSRDPPPAARTAADLSRPWPIY